MTTFYLDTKAVSDLVRTNGTETFISALAQFIEEDYRRWDDFTKSARLAVYYPDGLNELMPIADKDHFAFKFVNGHPKNPLKGLLTVIAFGVLSENASGYPVLISDLTLVTALRTAATSALTAKYLARKNAKTMAIIGCGAQSEFQLLAFKALLGVTEVRAFDLNRAAIDRVIRNLDGMGIKITAAASAKEAVKGVDIVTTATAAKAKVAVLTPDMIEPGMHINAIGGDAPGKTELHPDVLKMGRVVVQYEPQTRIEGDIQQMPKDFPVVELWRVFSGAEPGRRSDSEVTIFDSVGFALEDFSSLRCLYGMAGGAGKPLDIVPQLEDPRDLFSLLRDR